MMLEIVLTSHKGEKYLRTRIASHRTGTRNRTIGTESVLELFDPAAGSLGLVLVAIVGVVLAGRGTRIASHRTGTRNRTIGTVLILSLFDPVASSLGLVRIAIVGIVLAAWVGIRVGVVATTVDQRAIAGSPGQLRNGLGFFRHDGSLDVELWGLEGLDLFDKLGISKVAGCFVGAFWCVSERQEILTEMVGHGPLALVLAVVEDVLQKVAVPATHVIRVVDIRSVRKRVPSAVVVHNPEKELDLRDLDGVGVRAFPIEPAVLGVRNVAGVLRGTVDVDSVPAIWKSHGDLQFVASVLGEERALGVAIAALAGSFVDAFRSGFALCNVKATNHAESIGKGGCCTRVPHVVGTGLGHNIPRIGICGSVVFVNGGVPVQRFVLFDVPRVFADGSGQELGVELELVAAIDSPGVDSRLGTIKGMDVIAHTIVAEDGIDAGVSDREIVHLDAGCVGEKVDLIDQGRRKEEELQD